MPAAEIVLVVLLGLTTFSVYALTERPAGQVQRCPGVFAGTDETKRPLGFLTGLTRWIIVDDGLTNDNPRALCAGPVRNPRPRGKMFPGEST